MDLDYAIQISQLIYNVSFFIFTFVLVMYSIKTYNNEKKQPYTLLARINYSFINEMDDINIVMLDIFNSGDYAAKMVKIQLIVNHNAPIELDCINFIAPKENFGYYVGKRERNKLILFNGKEYNLADPMDYAYFSQNTNQNVVTLNIRAINI